MELEPLSEVAKMLLTLVLVSGTASSIYLGVIVKDYLKSPKRKSSEA